ncbi:hypothetical protein SAMN05216360_114212 [Methylobacterium phyllostachyos]|uniref:Uncharacterized protein n=1 Tax=Methylobacterium phyllostachyos TaxID=582672 RepID=A0A1H0GS19_9HYPH|nr:hypothetical protein [Methylobacterium phyllostachyos]SDO09856.1 hypothetical protein SAMN05216360_114212 [Methylobacterium phyllostachyos]
MAIRTTLPLLALILAAPASAQGYGGAPYAPAYADTYGFAGEFVRGDYIGAPLTHVPSPTQIVPSPWSYGTYGVPTVSGIAAAPTAQPSLTVIRTGSPKARRQLGALEEDRTTGARIIAIQVPRR